jgi:anti-sigma28 factor (negative regulator of flagellin synthesis)
MIMVGVTRIGGVAEPANPRRVTEREKQGKNARAGAEDEVSLSTVATFAAKMREEEESELRTERLQEIRDALDRGTYQIQEVVLQVAARLGKYLAV